MNIRVSELENEGYQLFEKLEHQGLVPFLKTYLNKRTRISRLYYAANIILFLIAACFFIEHLLHPKMSSFDWAYHYFIGFSIAFLLVPLHEYLHVLAYQSQGAKHTSYDMNLKKFYFMALADKFVANEKEFRIIALTPVTVISSILLVLLLFSTYNWTLTILGILFCHTAMCSGDFALLSFFEYHKEKQIVTFDEVENKISYFYEKIK